MLADTGWKTGQVQPRHMPIFSKSKPLNDRWKWRSLRLSDNQGQQYVLYFQISPGYGKWQAFLVLIDPVQPTCIFRIEDQPAPQAGLHVHAHCDGDPDPGARSINMPTRLPDHGSICRRVGIAWTPETFIDRCCVILRVALQAPDDIQGKLFDDA